MYKKDRYNNTDKQNYMTVTGETGGLVKFLLSRLGRGVTLCL